MKAARPPVDYIERTREQYSALGYGAYRWVRSAGPPPWTRPEKVLAQSKLGLVASGGIYVAGQVAFHYRDDVSLRIVPRDTPTADLRVTHFAYDLADARSDPNVVFPLDTLRDLERDGTIGELSERAYTFMGGIYSARKVQTLLAPAIADRLVRDEVDLALLVPV